MVAGTNGWGSPAPDPATATLGRRNRYQGDYATGTVTGRSYGSAGSSDLMIGSDARGEPAAYPGHGTGGFLTGTNSLFGLRRRARQEPGAWYNPGGPGGAYGGGWADGVLTVRDRHIMARTGSVRHSPAPANGVSPVNPAADWPYAGRPEYQMIDTTESWQLGTDNTANQDNSEPKNTVPVQHAAAAAVMATYGLEWTGRTLYPLGTQDGNQTLVFGPPPGEWREYGARGPAGMHGPAADVYDPNWVPARGAGGAGGRGLLVEAGVPGMQPGDRRLVWGGPPHGLHSPTVNSTRFTGARFASTIQMAAPRLDRPASSKIAGQSYSQTVVSEAGAGYNQSNRTPRIRDAGREPGLRSRFLTRT